MSDLRTENLDSLIAAEISLVLDDKTVHEWKSIDTFFDYLTAKRSDQYSIDGLEGVQEVRELLLNHTRIVHIRQLPEFLKQNFFTLPKDRVLFMLWTYEAKFNFSDFYQVLKAQTYEQYSPVKRQINTGEKIMEDSYNEFIRRDRDAMFILTLPKIGNLLEFQKYTGSSGGLGMLNGEIRELIYILKKKEQNPEMKIPRILLIHGVDINSDITGKIMKRIELDNLIFDFFMEKYNFSET